MRDPPRRSSARWSRCGTSSRLATRRPSRWAIATGRTSSPARDAPVGMKAAFNAMGGHGTDYSEVRYMSTRDYASGQVCTVRDGSKLYDYPGGLAIGTVDPPLTGDYLGHHPSGRYVLISSELDGESQDGVGVDEGNLEARTSACAPARLRRCRGRRARAGQGGGARRQRGALTVDRFPAFTTQKEPALTASFLAAVLRPMSTTSYRRCMAEAMTRRSCSRSARAITGGSREPWTGWQAASYAHDDGRWPASVGRAATAAAKGRPGSWVSARDQPATRLAITRTTTFPPSASLSSKASGLRAHVSESASADWSRSANASSQVPSGPPSTTRRYSSRTR